MKTYIKLYIFSVLGLIGELSALEKGQFLEGVLFAIVAGISLFAGMRLWHEENLDGPHD